MKKSLKWVGRFIADNDEEVPREVVMQDEIAPEKHCDRIAVNHGEGTCIGWR